MTQKDLKIILGSQKNEITELEIYRYLSKKERDFENRKILERISEDEERHYQFLKNLTKKELKPNKIKVWFYIFLIKILGLSFALKLMEKGEKISQKTYKVLERYHPEFAQIFQQEQKHEELLVNLIKDSRLEYAGSFVLGLNDALIELTGALAVLTLSLEKTKLIAFIGFITGVAASLSMSASEYLSAKEEEKRDPLLSALITGIAYFLTVFLLILPYLIFKNALIALILTLFLASLIILGFNFYVATVKNVSFKERALKMFLISFGVALFNFLLGFLIRKTFKIEI